MSKKKLPKKTVDDDTKALDNLSDFMERIKARIASREIEEILENMELIEFNRLHAYVEALYRKRNALAGKSKDLRQRLRASKDARTT
jgi:uncharacterized protein YeeX (DUF496 family)